MKGFITLALATAACVGLPATANASVIVNFTEVGGDVVATLAGSLDLTDLTSDGFYGLDVAAGGASTYGYAGFGVQNADVLGYTGFAGPSAWGSGLSGFTYATSSTPTSFAINASSFGDPHVFVAPDYTSGSALSGTATYAGASFASLGFDAGQYVYTSRSGQTVTVNIGAVPEPATWVMMMVGLALAGATLRRRSAATRVTVRYA